jgi:hypothetical protein
MSGNMKKSATDKVALRLGGKADSTHLEVKRDESERDVDKGGEGAVLVGTN